MTDLLLIEFLCVSPCVTVKKSQDRGQVVSAGVCLVHWLDVHSSASPSKSHASLSGFTVVLEYQATSAEAFSNVLFSGRLPPQRVLTPCRPLPV